jgi:hypothetical protein
MGDVDLVQLRLDPRVRQARQRVIAVGVLQIQGLQAQRIGLRVADLAERKLPCRFLGGGRELIRMNEDPATCKVDPEEGSLIPEDHTILTRGGTPDQIPRLHHTRPSAHHCN